MKNVSLFQGLFWLAAALGSVVFYYGLRSYSMDVEAFWWSALFIAAAFLLQPFTMQGVDLTRFILAGFAAVAPTVTLMPHWHPASLAAYLLTCFVALSIMAHTLWVNR